MFKIKIQYLKTEDFQELANFEEYESALDRYQKILLFFKIPHYLDYMPGEEKEYIYTHSEQNITLKLTHHEN
jgi:hypothetical protein